MADDNTTTILEATSDVAAAIEAGREHVDPRPIGEGGNLFAVPDGEGGTQIIDTRTYDEKWSEHPRAKAGRYDFVETASFAAYVKLHATDGAEVWINTGSHRAEAVLDGHAREHAGREDHRACLSFPMSPQWAVWEARDGKAMRQSDFAAFIEDNLLDIVDPVSADMLDIVSSLEAATKATFKSARRLSDGQTQLEYVEEISASAGTAKSGRLEIPAQFHIGIPVFRGGQMVKLAARFRYRINSGDLTMSYHLERRSDVIDAAFANEVAALRKGLPKDVPVYVG